METELMQSTGLSKDNSIVRKAMKQACMKFNLKMTTYKKGTSWEEWRLSTTYKNCNEVSDYLRYYESVFISVSNGKVSFNAGWK